MKLDRVVIGTDFSPPALTAAQWTARHFASGAELVLAHVVIVPEPPRLLRGRFPAPDALVATARAGAEARLRELGRSLGAERTQIEVRAGHAAEQLVDMATAYDADLIAVGRHGQRPGLWNRLGSTAEHLIRAAATPVLLVTGVRDVRPRRILVALDESDVAGVVADEARALGERFGADLTAIHVVGSAIMSHVLAAPSANGERDPLDHRTAQEEVRRELHHDADRWIEGLIGREVGPERVTSEVAFGEPGQEILAAAERHEAELIVMGSHGSARVRRALAGSVASEVLRGARCPVLVVPPPIDEIVD
jgi:nucleotide-binding universal stress UspA family protein